MHIRPIPHASAVVSLAAAETEFHENLTASMDARAMNAHAARFAACALSDWCHEHNQALPNTAPLPEWATALVWDVTQRLTEIGWAEIERREHEEALSHPDCSPVLLPDGRIVPHVDYLRRNA